MKEYQARVIIEKKDLDARIERLGAFLKSPRVTDLPAPALEQLLEQAGVMEKYSDVLRRRIESFDPVGEVATRATQIGPVTVDETGIDRLDVVLQHTLQAVKDRDAQLESRSDQQAELRRLGNGIASGILAATEALKEALDQAQGGWIIPNTKGTAFRCIDVEGHGAPAWTTDRNAALRFARRGDAEEFAYHDEEAGEPVEFKP